jgi:hypothetical protein
MLWEDESETTHIWNDSLQFPLLFCTKRITLHGKQLFKIRTKHYHCTRSAMYVWWLNCLSYVHKKKFTGRLQSTVFFFLRWFGRYEKLLLRDLDWNLLLNCNGNILSWDKNKYIVVNYLFKILLLSLYWHLCQNKIKISLGAPGTT